MQKKKEKTFDKVAQQQNHENKEGNYEVTSTLARKYNKPLALDKQYFLRRTYIPWQKRNSKIISWNILLVLLYIWKYSFPRRKDQSASLTFYELLEKAVRDRPKWMIPWSKTPHWLLAEYRNMVKRKHNSLCHTS